MRVSRITTNLPVGDIEQAKSFYTDYLGLSVEEFNLGWVARLTDPESGEHVQLVTHDATAPVDSALTVRVIDLDAAHEEAVAAGYEIVHPVTIEAWGVRRFFVRAPDGTVINVAQEHHA